MPESRSWIVAEGDAGDRLDLVLSSIADISRSQARRWIDAGLVCVNGGVSRPSHRVQTGDFLGTDHGQILTIDEGELELIEIVPDGTGGWVERARTVSLAGGA